MMYCRNSNLIELIPIDSFEYGYFTNLSAQLSNKYYSIIGYDLNKHEDFMIDVNKVFNLAKKITKNK